MGTPKKTKNGKWHTQVYVGIDETGKRIIRSVTADTKAECQLKASQLKLEKKPPSKMTVKDAVNVYIKSIESVASPPTIRGYYTILNHAFPDLMKMNVDDVDNLVMQRAISNESKRISQYGKPMSPKTVSNRYGLIETALRKVCNKTFEVKLPQRIVKIKEYPMPEDIFEAIKGTDIELPCLLAMWLSMTMSEIRGLECSSIRNGIIHIEQARVLSVDGDVLKPTAKNDSRIRNHKIPKYIMTLINNTDTYKNFAKTGENSPLIPMSANMIYNRWQKICRSHGWKMTFHDLRSVSASVMLMLNIPDKYAQQRGGWKTDHTLKTVYQQTFDSERQKVDALIDSYFEQFINC